MPIIIRCKSCRRRLSVPNKLLGTFITCPKCKAHFFVVKPAPGLSESAPAQPENMTIPTSWDSTPWTVQGFAPIPAETKDEPANYQYQALQVVSCPACSWLVQVSTGQLRVTCPNCGRDWKPQFGPSTAKNPVAVPDAPTFQQKQPAPPPSVQLAPGPAPVAVTAPTPSVPGSLTGEQTSTATVPTRPFNTTDIPPEQIERAIYAYAFDLAQKGLPFPEIQKKLEEEGVRPEAAATVVLNIRETKAKALKEAGQKNMAYGAVWCAGGIVVTALTYHAAAAAPKGGGYIVAWGAILFGAIQFLRGLFQATTPPSQ